MEKTNILVFLMIFGTLMTVVGLAIASNLLAIHNNGNVTSPANLTGTSNISWGNLTQGIDVSISKPITLTNVGQQATKPLDITVQWFTQQFATVTWNGVNSIINPGETKNYQVTLTVTNATFVGAFNFDIIIREV